MLGKKLLEARNRATQKDQRHRAWAHRAGKTLILTLFRGVTMAGMTVGTMSHRLSTA